MFSSTGRPPAAGGNLKAIAQRGARGDAAEVIAGSASRSTLKTVPSISIGSASRRGRSRSWYAIAASSAARTAGLRADARSPSASVLEHLGLGRRPRPVGPRPWRRRGTRGRARRSRSTSWSWRSAPAAALRGFANGSVPRSRARRFSRSKPARGSTTSPRTEAIARADASLASATGMRRTRAGSRSRPRRRCPSPRVEPRTSGPPRRPARRPPRRASARRRSRSARRSSSRRTRSSKARSSSSFIALSSESIGDAVRRRSRSRSAGGGADALRRRVGRRSSGWSRLEGLELAAERVVLGVGDLGRVLEVVERVVAASASAARRCGARPRAVGSAAFGAERSVGPPVVGPPLAFVPAPSHCGRSASERRQTMIWLEIPSRAFPPFAEEPSRDRRNGGAHDTTAAPKSRRAETHRRDGPHRPKPWRAIGLRERRASADAERVPRADLARRSRSSRSSGAARVRDELDRIS